MSEPTANKYLFNEFIEYYSDLHEIVEDIEGGRTESRSLESDRYEPHEKLGHLLVALGDPGWAIYEDIHEHGEGDTLLALTEDLIERGDEELAGNYWRQFQEADEFIRNPESNIYQRLDKAGMEESEIDHVREEYQQHVEPLLDGTMFD